MKSGTLLSLIHVMLALVLAPFLLSVINRTKALYSGRQGQRWLQPYYDLWRLLRKGALSITLDAVGLSTIARTIEQAGVAQAVDRLSMDGLLALWQPTASN